MEEKNVKKIVDVGADMESTKCAVELAYNYDFIYAAVGVHPSEVEEMSEHDIETLRKYVIDDSARDERKIVAIGEIGLDYHWEEPSRVLQKEWFVKQLELAQELEMPVVIHSRDAAEDTYELLSVYVKNGLRGVMHCYSYSVEMAKKYVDMGLYIGIGGVLTFKNAKKLDSENNTLILSSVKNVGAYAFYNTNLASIDLKEVEYIAEKIQMLFF